MDKQSKTILARRLRTLAEEYYAGEELCMEKGLCMMIYRRFRAIGCDCFLLLRELELISFDNPFLCPPGTCWPDRIMFALVLAEAIKQGGV